MEQEISLEERRGLIEAEIRVVRQNEYVLTTRYRVNKKIGSSPETLEAITKDLERCALFIDELTTIYNELK